jgi:potassium uptake TrkH family protein
MSTGSKRISIKGSSFGKLVSGLMRVAFWFGIIGLVTLIYDIGFEKPFYLQKIVLTIYLITLSAGIFFTFALYSYRKEKPGKKVWVTDFLLTILCLVLLNHIVITFNEGIPERHPWLTLAIVLLFFREMGNFKIEIKKQYLNPAQLFIISFIGIILAGTFLLLLPRSTHTGISFLDALFTSTSAVCVTGLTVVDTGKFFTPLGQTFLIILIQTGGLGIMTFTSYFGYFFKGGASYQNRLMIQDMTNSERIADVFNTLKKILLITFFIEMCGALIILASLDHTLIPALGDRIFFSVFHAVSAFCNAGFSTLSNSLFEAGYRFNYTFHLAVAGLVIIGGIGFPIVFTALTWLKHFFLETVLKKEKHKPWLLGINSRIVIITTACLLFFGTVIIYGLEYNNTLAEHSGMGKVITAFFGATTPRTAGFNSLDMNALHFSTIMVLFILMWIGASPGSTGGGIKTSTFAIAVLNFMSLARGKDRVEIFRREISPISTRRAFAAISLSMVVIGTAVLILSLTEKGKDLMPLAFETVSAFGTVGLSLGITSSLTDAGKIIIILTMFIGRVSMLAILVSFLRRVVNLKYKYPAEDVLIN